MSAVALGEDAEAWREMRDAGWVNYGDGDLHDDGDYERRWFVWAPKRITGFTQGRAEQGDNWELAHHGSEPSVQFATLRALYTYCQLMGIGP